MANMSYCRFENTLAGIMKTRFNFFNTTVLVEFVPNNQYPSKKVSFFQYWNEGFRKTLKMGRLFFVAYERGQETYTQAEDCDICSSCGDHTDFEYDIETDEFLGSSCCGAKKVDTDYESDYDR